MNDSKLANLSIEQAARALRERAFSPPYLGEGRALAGAQ